MTTFDDMVLWRKDRLQAFLRARGLPTTGKKDELRALVYGADYFKIPLKPTAEAEEKDKAERYNTLLKINGTILPGPLSALCIRWVGEVNGMSLWPPCMYVDLTEYLINDNEKDLRTRLLTDYKEGKAYSYFDSKWLKEVFYHPISDDSKYCYLKSKCTPSMNIYHEPHDVWVCITKKTGKILSAYCSCFAGLGSSCNHVAAILFKCDYAWQNGLTNKACTSLPASWTAPSTKLSKCEVKPMRLKDMEWRKPHYAKDNEKIINQATRMLFKPADKPTNPTLESLMGSLYMSCPNASVFQYASPEASATYETHDDVNVLEEIEVLTSAGILPLLKEIAHRIDGDLDISPPMNKSDVLAIEEATRSQNTNDTWKSQRIGRITSYSAHKVLTKVRKLERPRC